MQLIIGTFLVPKFRIFLKEEAERLGTKDEIDDATPSDQQFTAGREVSDEEAAIDVPEVAEDHGAAAEGQDEGATK